MGNTLRRIIGVGGTLILVIFVWIGAKQSRRTYSVMLQPYTNPTALEVRAFGGLLYRNVNHDTFQDIQEEIKNEIMYGEIELLAQLIEAEAGNQDELGKRYVADVPLNRVDDPDYPDTLEEVVFQKSPVQFSCISDGNFDKAGWNISEESFRIAYEEYTGTRANSDILYYRTERYSDCGHPAFKHGDHYFSTK